MTDFLQQARRRALHHWVEDGLPDLYVGMLFLLFAGLRLLAQWADGQQRRELAAVGFFGSLALLLTGTLAGRFVIEALKQRITYPRTGYVAYAPPSRQERRKSWLFTLLLALLLLAAVVFKPRAQLLFRMAVLHGVLFLVALAVYFPLRSPRYFLYAMSIPVLALGYAWTWERWSPMLQRMMTYGEVTFLFLGVLMTLGGLLTLVRYLQRHPVLEEV